MSLLSYRTRNVLFTSYTFTLHREEKTWSTGKGKPSQIGRYTSIETIKIIRGEL